MRILLVEDDILLGESLRNGLTQEGYAVDWMKNGKEASASFNMVDYEAILLDLMLPDANGLDLLTELRKSGKLVPVLIMTARDAIDDRIKGLDFGADDYLVKPFDVDELFARLRSLIRRSKDRAELELVYQDIILNPGTHMVTRHGEPQQLSAKEFMVLRVLLENLGRFISKAKLAEAIYGWDSEVESNTVEVYISSLRKKLGKDLIVMMRNIGYRINKADK